MEREEGKLTSQERFWQARLLSKEAEYRTQLTAIHQQLEALKDTTNHAKADLETSQSVPNHNKEQPQAEEMKKENSISSEILFPTTVELSSSYIHKPVIDSPEIECQVIFYAYLTVFENYSQNSQFFNLII